MEHYKVEKVESTKIEEVEQKVNEMAIEGWKLISITGISQAGLPFVARKPHTNGYVLVFSKSL